MNIIIFSLYKLYKPIAQKHPEQNDYIIYIINISSSLVENPQLINDCQRFQFFSHPYVSSVTHSWSRLLWTHSLWVKGQINPRSQELFMGHFKTFWFVPMHSYTTNQITNRENWISLQIKKIRGDQLRLIIRNLSTINAISNGHGQIVSFIICSIRLIGKSDRIACCHGNV